MTLTNDTTPPPRARLPVHLRRPRKLTWTRLALYRFGAPIGLGLLWLMCRFLPRVRVLGRERMEQALAEHGAVIPVFWHGQLGVIGAELVWGKPYGIRLGVLASPSVDGEWLVLIAPLIGMSIIRGSPTRTGAASLRALHRAVARDGVSPMLAPDGSQGPRRVFKPGALLLSQLSGRPIVPMAYAARRVWLLPTWDRHAVPWPFTRLVVAYGEPRVIPRGLEAPEFERCRLEMEQELGTLFARAQAVLGD